MAGLAISLADPGGPIETAKESMASLKNATNPPSREQLLSEVALEIQGMAQQRQNPLSGFRPTGASPGEAVLAQLTEVQRVVAAKATPGRRPGRSVGWLVRSGAGSGRRREGWAAVLGFSGGRAGERRGSSAALDRVRAALGG